MALNTQLFSIPFHLTRSVETSVGQWIAGERVRRLWDKDASLWTGSNEGAWMGWLGIVGTEVEREADFQRISEDVRSLGVTDALLVGMGGSSLCPEVLQSTFGDVASYPKLRVVDSTDPAQVRAREGALDLSRTLLIVSSKSGTTLESSILFEHFYSRLLEVMSPVEAANHSMVITDPGSPLEELARQRQISRVFPGPVDIGGRFSALSDFGLVPAAVMGLDVGTLLGRAKTMVDACGRGVEAERNPGVLLGIVLGCLSRAGRDKMTILTSREFHAFGAWLEQLVAESTGKQGHGIVPVDREPHDSVGVYGTDRFFVSFKRRSEGSEETPRLIDALEAAGHPVVRIELDELEDIAQEFFRWEVATAVAGSLLGVNPFTQPDVEASKVAARRITARFVEEGTASERRPVFEESGFQLFATAKLFGQLAGRTETPSLNGYLRAYLSLLQEGDYFSIQAYLEMKPAHEALLDEVRALVHVRARVATCLGFGPRFLHSTGQLHKGGPATGVFMQITCEDADDIRVPGRSYTFGQVKAAQAAGDMEVLEASGRRILRIHLGADVAGDLERLRHVMAQAAG